MTPKLLGPDRDAEAERLRRLYDNGATIRALATDTGRSYCYIRDLLRHAHTQMRPRGFEPGHRPQRKEVTAMSNWLP